MLEKELVFDAAHLTHVGQLREVNQDAATVDMGIYAVADGMGGHAAGEVAAAMAVESLGAVIRMAGVEDLINAVKAANRAITERAEKEPELKGMGTTIVAMASYVDRDVQYLGLVNVGDSRGYRFADGTLSQLTDDHSLVAGLVRDGLLRPDQAEQHPQKNVITRALGIDPNVEVDRWVLTPVAGERYLLCSDGLFNEVSDASIIEVLSTFAFPEDAVAELVDRANAGGGRDNITVLVLDVLDPDVDDREARAAEALANPPAAVAEAAGTPASAPKVDDDTPATRLRRLLGRKKGNPSDGAK